MMILKKNRTMSCLTKNRMISLSRKKSRMIRMILPGPRLIRSFLRGLHSDCFVEWMMGYLMAGQQVVAGVVSEDSPAAELVCAVLESGGLSAAGADSGAVFVLWWPAWLHEVVSQQPAWHFADYGIVRSHAVAGNWEMYRFEAEYSLVEGWQSGYQDLSVVACCTFRWVFADVQFPVDGQNLADG